jgi:hypothetical protein
MNSYLIGARNFIIENFFVSIKAIEYKKYKFINSYFFLLLKIIPFTFMKIFLNYLNCKYIYYYDNIYHSNYIHTFSLRPSILSFKVSNNESESEKLIDEKEYVKKFKLYQFSIPFWFFIYNEKLENYTNFEIKYFSKGKIVDTSYKFEDFKTKLLIDIF